MRVLLVANALPPADLSGAGEQVVQLAAGLREVGHEVRILGRGPGGARGPKVFFPLTVLPAAWRVLRSFRPHVVQVHESDGALVAFLVAVIKGLLDPEPLLAVLFQVSYVEERRAVRPVRAGGRVLGRPGWVERRFRWWKAPIQILLGWLTAETANLVFAPSRTTAAEIERDYRVTPVRVLPNVTEVPAESHEAHEVPADSGGVEPPGYLLFVGRLRIRKGVEVLLAALEALSHRHPPVRLLVAGDGEHRRALEALTTALGLAPSVRFLGRCSPEEVRRLLGSAQTLVVPSLYEGMPLVILEAMAAGVPVIASAVSGIPEVVVDGVTGWLVPPEDPEVLAQALAQALDDPDEARRRGQAGRRRVVERYHPGAAAALWLQEIQAFIPGPPPGEEEA